MSHQPFLLLEQTDEDALHLTRMLGVEERPFQRVSKRLVGKNSMIRSFPTQLATPPPDESSAEDAETSLDSEHRKQELERRQWREDVLLDFQLLESTMVRIQFLKNSNERERERYAIEKSKILETAQAVRDNTAELRTQLEEAQRMLALRKTYDELTEKITSNRMLKPRDEQYANIEKLNSEISDLEQEGKDYGATWDERRMQFGRITAEGAHMMKLIRGEKDDPDRDEGMDDAEDGEEGEGSTTKGEGSRMGTPKLENGGATPLRGGLDSDEGLPASQNKLLQRAMGLGVATPGASRASSPGRGAATPAGTKDTEMEEVEAAAQATPASDGLEEGEAEESVADEEQMDVT